MANLSFHIIFPTFIGLYGNQLWRTLFLSNIVISSVIIMSVLDYFPSPRMEAHHDRNYFFFCSLIYPVCRELSLAWYRHSANICPTNQSLTMRQQLIQTINVLSFLKRKHWPQKIELGSCQAEATPEQPRMFWLPCC